MDLRRIYFFRHGTEKPTTDVVMSYPKIARRMKLAVSTVFNACRRFE